MSIQSEGLAQATAEAARLFNAGQFAAAAAVYRQLLERAPNHPEACFNYACTLRALQDTPAALAAFARAARLKPNWVSPLLQQGNLLHATGQPQAAAELFEQALAIDADNLPANYNLARCYLDLGRDNEALRHLQRARAIAPMNEAVWLIYREALRRLGRHREALADFLLFEQQAAPSAWLVAAGLDAARQLGDWSREQRALDGVLQWPWQSNEVEALRQIFGLIQCFDLPREALRDLYATHDRLSRPRQESLVKAQRQPGRRWRIGYVSADLRSHVMGHLLRRVFDQHDVEHFEIYLYSLVPEFKEDRLTQEFAARAQGFRRIAGLDDAAAAACIAGDDLDILVDLMGHTAYAKPWIYVHQPARVQLTHLGYHGALGLREIDFKVTDVVADLPDCENYQLEGALRLSVCVLPMDRQVAAGTPPPSRHALGLPADSVVCATFVASTKLSPRCLDLWKRLLEAEPAVYLAFSPLAPEVREAIKDRLEGFGIPPERVIFIPAGSTVGEQRLRYTQVDFALDTLPYSGGDTTMAALDMSVPVVTLCGTRHSERMSTSILRHLGVTETIAENDEQYLTIALRLAREPEWRASIARQIGEQLLASGLADTKRYTRALEEAYLEALRRKGLRRDEQILPD